MHHCSTTCGAARRRYAAGLTADEAGYAVGVAAPTVLAWVREHGEPVRRQSTRRQPPGWQAEALKLYKAGWYQTRIGQKLEVSRERVRQLLAQHGLRSLYQGHPHICGPVCEYVTAHPGPLSVRDIARAVRVAAPAVSHARRFHPEWIIVRGTGGRPHRCGDKCTRLRMALVGARSTRAACLVAGVSYAYATVNLTLHHPDWPWPHRPQKKVLV